jgi:hypothetical protein
VQGELPQRIGVHASVLLAYGSASFYLALVLVRRRLLK